MYKRIAIVASLSIMFVLGVTSGYHRGTAQGLRWGIDAAIDMFGAVADQKRDADFPQPPKGRDI